MSSYCEGKVAVVTGAGGTLCSAIAKDLARQGARVVLIGRTRERLEKVAKDARCPSVRVEPGDVTDERAMMEIAERVAAEWGPCRFLINGAGGNNVKAMPTRLRFSDEDLKAEIGMDARRETRDVSGDQKTIDNTSHVSRLMSASADRGFFDIDMEAFKSVLEINTIGTVIPSRIFGLQMAKAGGGAILNFA